LGKIEEGEPIQHICSFLTFSLRVSLLKKRFSLAMSYNALKDVMIKIYFLEIRTFLGSSAKKKTEKEI
jgi:hypothetical protein